MTIIYNLPEEGYELEFFPAQGRATIKVHAGEPAPALRISSVL